MNTVNPAENRRPNPNQIQGAEMPLFHSTSWHRSAPRGLA